MSMTPINWLPLKKPTSSSAADQKPPAASTAHKSPLFSLQRRPQQQELLLFLLLLPMRFASTTALPIPPGPPISPRFLHFSLQLLPDWWSDPETRVLAVFESVDSGPKGWQMVVQLFANQPGRQMPFSTLLNISHGGHGWQRPILADQMPECEPEPADVQQQNVQLEVELSPNFLYVRAKNAAKYPLPTPLLASGDLRVFFVRLEQKKGQPERGCQLRSELDFKETSQFALPSTTPHPFAAERTTTSSSSTTTAAPPTPSSSMAPTTSSSAIINSMTRSPSSTTDNNLVDQRRNGAAAAEEPSAALAASQLPPLKNQWPYKMKRVKVPRRSTLAAQRYLSPNHYVPQQGRNNQQGQRMFPPRTSTIGTAGWPPAPFGPRTTPTPASYIDIIRDRELYEQVQRSRTMEINSQWSPISMLFMGLIAVLISLSATFALAMFILLQCRPKPKSLLIAASHS